MSVVLEMMTLRPALLPPPLERPPGVLAVGATDCARSLLAATLDARVARRVSGIVVDN